ncbi:MAG: hypothetical protein HBSAPP03_24290 [Phycisphaerae bacterium]|nr:MAG: hypothetical protein HBSAPP03_24290 [Phycisphaerae bacterium]
MEQRERWWKLPKGRGGLVAANVVLLAVLIGLSLVTPAGAGHEAQPPGRARGEYTMVAGKISSGGSSVVYVVDTSNQEVVAMKWDASRQTMTGVGYRSLSADSRATPGR